MKRTIIAAAVCLSLPLLALAQQSDTQKQQVKPGSGPTEAVGQQVPPMKGCPDKAQVDTKAQGTEATEEVGKNVPTMTAENKDCPDTGQQTKKN